MLSRHLALPIVSEQRSKAMLSRVLLVLGLLLITVMPVVANDDLEAVTAAMEGGALLLNDLQADFVQRASVPGISGETKGKGQLFLKKGKGGTPLFRFNYSKPKQTLVSDGRTVWFHLPENNQVLVTDSQGAMAGDSATAINILTGLGKLSSEFTVRFAGKGRDAKGNYLLELTPRKKSPVYSKLQVTVSAEAVGSYLAVGKATDPFPLKSSTVYDTAGGHTTMEFSNVRANAGIESSRFTFTPPKGAEVIKQ